MEENKGKLEIDLNKSTRALINFTVEIDQFEMLLSYMRIGNSFISENMSEAKERLIKLHDNSSDETDFLKTDPERFLTMNYYESHLSRMMYIRAIDNFTTYFKDVLAEIVIKKPQILKSKDQERLDFILEHDTMENLLKSISEKKITELFYSGFTDIQKYFNDRLGIKMFEDEIRTAEINLLIKQRNLAVHNRGKISKEFITEFPNEDFIEGLFLSFKFDYVSRINDILYNIINNLDAKLSVKFNLDQVNYQ